jgi:hypothetical protein
MSKQSDTWEVHLMQEKRIHLNTPRRFSRTIGALALSSLLMVALVAGCSDDDNGPTGGTPDTTAPTVLSTNPINGSTNIALVNATFSEAMSEGSITSSSFIVRGPGVTAVPGTVTYDAANNRALFVPTTDLPAATFFTATISTTVEDRSGNALTNNYVWNFTSSAVASPQLPVELLTTLDYVVLAGSTISSTGNTNITGDIGLSPGTSVVGFPPGIITGGQHVGDPSATQAKLDLTTTYNSCASRVLNPVTLVGNIGGMTLPPGLYKSTSGLTISSGDLTLDAKGNANAIWIFQIASTLSTTSGRKVILTGGAKAANIYWQVGSSATLGTTSVFKGNILADQSISMNTGASLEGRAFARIGAVTLNGNTVVRPLP